VNKEEEREEKEKKTRKNKDFHFLLFDIKLNNTKRSKAGSRMI